MEKDPGPFREILYLSALYGYPFLVTFLFCCSAIPTSLVTFSCFVLLETMWLRLLFHVIGVKSHFGCSQHAIQSHWYLLNSLATYNSTHESGLNTSGHC